MTTVVHPSRLPTRQMKLMSLQWELLLERALGSASTVSHLPPGSWKALESDKAQLAPGSRIQRRDPVSTFQAYFKVGEDAWSKATHMSRGVCVCVWVGGGG